MTNTMTTANEQENVLIMKWIKIGKTNKCEYPKDHTKDVQFAVIENEKLVKVWIGRNTIITDEHLNKIEPTHWRYVC